MLIDPHKRTKYNVQECCREIDDGPRLCMHLDEKVETGWGAILIYLD